MAPEAPCPHQAQLAPTTTPEDPRDPTAKDPTQDLPMHQFHPMDPLEVQATPTRVDQAQDPDPCILQVIIKYLKCFPSCHYVMLSLISYRAGGWARRRGSRLASCGRIRVRLCHAHHSCSYSSCYIRQATAASCSLHLSFSPH